eukprot:gene5690-7242_t
MWGRALALFGPRLVNGWEETAGENVISSNNERVIAAASPALRRRLRSRGLRRGDGTLLLLHTMRPGICLSLMTGVLRETRPAAAAVAVVAAVAAAAAAAAAGAGVGAGAAVVVVV